LFHGHDVLLLKGDPDKRIWPNRYNGIGGHLEAGEDLLTAAQREIVEETGLPVDDLCLRGVVIVDVEPEAGVLIGVFTGSVRSREFDDSPEGRLAWFAVDHLPVSELVPDVPWLLARLTGDGSDLPPFSARYHYDEDGKLVIEFAGQPSGSVR
jgi:8-oxo-dGTP diphosphatase